MIGVFLIVVAQVQSLCLREKEPFLSVVLMNDTIGFEHMITFHKTY